MAKHGILFESDNFITKCINRAGVSTVNVDGGAPVAIGGVNSTDKELYNVTTYTDETQVGIAFNPSVKYDVIGGNYFPAKSLDDRDYYNIANRALDFFIPEKNVEFGVTIDNIDGTTAPTVGQFLEPKASSNLFEIKASQTASVPSFKVVDIKEVKYPTFGFDDEVVSVYIVQTVYNG